MNGKIFDKIILVSLCDKFTRDLGNFLSQNLGMIFCDAKELVEYELVDKKAMEELCSVEYLEKSEKKVAKHIASFENVVVSIGYDYLMHNLDILKEKSLICFVKLPKSFVKANGEAINEIAYDARTADLEKISDVTLSVRKTDVEFVVEKIISNLRRFV